jgi:reductive dehalogenase
MGVALVLQAIVGLTYLISSIWENEKRASVFAALQFAGMLVLFLFFIWLVSIDFFERAYGIALLILVLVLGAAAAVILLRKAGVNPKALKGTKGLIRGEVKRFDERAHVFARNRALRPGSEQYEVFYREHPEMEAYDKERRERGGPMGPTGVIDRPHGKANVAGALASLNIPLYLSTPEKVTPSAHFALDGKKVEISPEEATERIKGYILNLGAVMVGVAEINPSWIYSHRGEIFHENWEDWGEEIHLPHTYAVVFAEEMDFRLIAPAPHTPTLMESMKNYAKGAYIAAQSASFIANLGYSATANHLRHYDGLMVPLAVDAGLGELSRMGYLITKEFGPRIRLSAVTTDLTLIPDKPVDIGVEDFCKFCKKCAVCCPSQSIPMEDQTVVNGTRRWKINAETCFGYWGKVGTDCNVCMKVCPWSHARTFPHKVIVELITRNWLSRRIFSIMDDIFYGKKPKPHAAPHWARYKKG